MFFSAKADSRALAQNSPAKLILIRLLLSGLIWLSVRHFWRPDLMLVEVTDSLSVRSKSTAIADISMTN